MFSPFYSCLRVFVTIKYNLSKDVGFISSILTTFHYFCVYLKTPSIPTKIQCYNVKFNMHKYVGSDRNYPVFSSLPFLRHPGLVLILSIGAMEKVQNMILVVLVTKKAYSVVFILIFIIFA